MKFSIKDLFSKCDQIRRIRKYILESIKVPSNNIVYKNKKGKRGERFGAYIKEKFNFIAREGLT